MKASELIQACMLEYKSKSNLFMCNLLEDYERRYWVGVVLGLDAIQSEIGEYYTLHQFLLAENDNYIVIFKHEHVTNWMDSSLHKLRIEFYENLITKLKSEGK